MKMVVVILIRKTDITSKNYIHTLISIYMRNDKSHGAIEEKESVVKTR
jgi:hypothetical protein